MRSRRQISRALFAASLLVGLVHAGRADAAAMPELVLEGSRAGAAMLSLSRPTTLILSDDTLLRRRASYATNGTHVGVAVHASDGQLVGSAFAARGFAGPIPSLVYVGQRTESLRLLPGRYRVSLLGPSGGRVRLPVVSGSALGRPRLLLTPPKVQAAWTELDALQRSSASFRGLVGAKTAVGMAVASHYVSLYHSEFSWCLAPAPATCIPGVARESSSSATGGSLSESSMSYSAVQRSPSASPSGPRPFDAVLQVVDAGVTSARFTLFIFLD
jgi:hypothetical protein